LEARGEPDIYRIDITSKKISWLMDKPVWAAPMEFSPEGKKLLIINGPKQAVSVISFGQGNPEITKLSSGDVIDSYPHWSKDRQRILFIRQEGQNQDIYWKNADGSGLVNLTEGSGVLNARPNLSPDGQKIIYLTNHDRQWDTMIMNADGSGKTRVTDIFCASGLVSWKP
jgi:TolB protein